MAIEKDDASRIRRGRKQNRFTTIDNQPLENSNLSWKAKGLLTYLMSKSENWEVKLEFLKTVSTDGRESTNAGLRELIENGYVRRTRLTNQKGRFEGYLYEVSDIAFFDIEEEKNAIQANQSINGFSVYGETENGKTENGFEINEEGKNAIQANQSINGFSVYGETENGKTENGFEINEEGKNAIQANQSINGFSVYGETVNGKTINGKPDTTKIDYNKNNLNQENSVCVENFEKIGNFENSQEVHTHTPFVENFSEEAPSGGLGAKVQKSVRSTQPKVAQKGRQENLSTSFQESPYNTIENFTALLSQIGFESADAPHYFRKISNLCKSKGTKSQDWEAYIVLWLTDDQQAGKLKTAGKTTKAQTTNQPPTTEIAQKLKDIQDYLESPKTKSQQWYTLVLQSLRELWKDTKATQEEKTQIENLSKLINQRLTPNT
jgi:hypothetical protein